MCYDVRYLTKKLADYEKRYGDLADLTEIAKKIDPSYQPNPRQYFHVNAFSHESLPVITSASSAVSFYDWGLIPHWVSSTTQAMAIQQKTLNARGEELFEKPSIRDPAKSKRCIILLDGFYEHHHKSGRVFPYHIQFQDRQPMSVAGLWEEWEDQDSAIVRRTCTIVTTEGNELMGEIHNNPKQNGPRMPVILNSETE